MKKILWRILVILVLVTGVASFLWIFTPDRTGPFLWSMPYALWTGILMTVVLVVFTLVGSLIFPHKEDGRS